MTQQAMPFFESAEDATRHAISVSGIAPKAVAAALWPSMKQDSAYARLMNSLNPDKPEKLSADEHAFIAQHCRQFDFLYYVCHRLSHSRPHPVAPEDKRAMLQQSFIDAVKHLDVLRKELEAAA